MPIYNLLPNEQLLETFGVSKRIVFIKVSFGLAFMMVSLVLGAFLRNFFVEFFGIFGDLVAVAVLSIPALVGLYLIISAIILFYNYKYYITNQRVIEVVGIFSKRTVSSAFEAITDVVVKQDIVERYIYKTGKVFVNTAGSPEMEIVLLGVNNPYAYKQKIQNQIGKNHQPIIDKRIRRIPKTTKPHDSWFKSKPPENS